MEGGLPLSPKSPLFQAKNIIKRLEKDSDKKTGKDCANNHTI